MIERQTHQTKAPPACRELIRRVRPLVDELFTLILAAHKNRQLNHDPLSEGKRSTEGHRELLAMTYSENIGAVGSDFYRLGVSLPE